MPKNYIPRIMDKILEERLSFKSAVLIEGPKWCGKTTTAKQISKSVLAMDQPDLARQYREMAELNPTLAESDGGSGPCLALSLFPRPGSDA